MENKFEKRTTWDDLKYFIKTDNLEYAIFNGVNTDKLPDGELKDLIQETKGNIKQILTLLETK